MTLYKQHLFHGTPYFGALVWFIARIGLDGKVKGQRQGGKCEKEGEKMVKRKKKER